MNDDDYWRLMERIKRLEEVVRNLAQATSEWSGGSYDGASYSDSQWRQKVLKAVEEIGE